MKRKTFKQQAQEIPAPNQITLDTPLPYVFDLHWDYKTYEDLAHSERNQPSKEQLRLLREAGFDTKSLPKYYDKEILQTLAKFQDQCPDYVIGQAIADLKVYNFTKNEMKTILKKCNIYFTEKNFTEKTT